MKYVVESKVSLPNLFGFNETLTVEKGNHPYSIGHVCYLRDESDILMTYKFRLIGLGREHARRDPYIDLVVNEAVAQVVLNSSLMEFGQGVHVIGRMGDGGPEWPSIPVDAPTDFRADMISMNAIDEGIPVSNHGIDITYTAQWWLSLNTAERYDVWRKLNRVQVPRL